MRSALKSFNALLGNSASILNYNGYALFLSFGVVFWGWKEIKLWVYKFEISPSIECMKCSYFTSFYFVHILLFFALLLLREEGNLEGS